jgi:tetratricopeptide (TPR) repeat protein
MMREDFPKALDYFFKGLNANAELGDKWGVSTDLGNIAIIYQYQGDLTNSLIYSEKSLKMSEELNDKEGIINGLSNLGSVYASQAEKNPSSSAANGLYKKSLDYFQRAQKVADETSDINRSAMNQVSMGDVYIGLHDYKNALLYFSEGAKLGTSVGELTAISGGNEGLSKVYTLTKKFDSALVYYKKYIVFRDSIFNEENIKKSTQAEMEQGFHKKLVSDSLLVAEEKKVTEAELHSEKNKQMSLYGGLALVLLFAGFIYQRFRITQRQKKIIEEQKLLVEQQKYAVEEKQKQVTDSIQYAKRIQDALLPSERFISRYLNKK